jgi:hypothetical protein
MDIQAMTVATVGAICKSMIAHMQDEKVLLTKDQMKKIAKIEIDLREVYDVVVKTF